MEANPKPQNTNLALKVAVCVAVVLLTTNVVYGMDTLVGSNLTGLQTSFRTISGPSEYQLSGHSMQLRISPENKVGLPAPIGVRFERQMFSKVSFCVSAEDNEHMLMYSISDRQLDTNRYKLLGKDAQAVDFSTPQPLEKSCYQSDNVHFLIERKYRNYSDNAEKVVLVIAPE